MTTTLPGTGRVNGAQLTLSVNTSLASGARAALRRILLVSGLAALVLSGLLVAVAVRLALRPLDSMAALASEIAAGRPRRSRLSPTRTDTEIGRTAHAFDAMLDELEGAETRARRAEEQTRAFLADAAHELRTPLAGVQAAAETLLQHRDRMSVEDQQHIEALLVGETQRAGRLVSDLLSVARLDAGVAPGAGAGRPRPLADAEAARARLVWPTRTVESSGSAPTITGDAQALAGVLRNLVDNACRAVGDGGTVRLQLSGEAAETAGTAEAVIEVVDDGPGVAAEDRERIFERLVRLDAARSADSGGSGLGLAIARGTARAHGGDLVYRPAPGRRGGVPPGAARGSAADLSGRLRRAGRASAGARAAGARPGPAGPGRTAPRPPRRPASRRRRRR